jgi:hypothetical protein
MIGHSPSPTEDVSKTAPLHPSTESRPQRARYVAAKDLGNVGRSESDYQRIGQPGPTYHFTTRLRRPGRVKARSAAFSSRLGVLGGVVRRSARQRERRKPLSHAALCRDGRHRRGIAHPSRHGRGRYLESTYFSCVARAVTLHALPTQQEKRAPRARSGFLGMSLLPQKIQ